MSTDEASLAHDVVQLRIAIDMAIHLIAAEMPERARSYLIKVLLSEPTDARQNAADEDEEDT